MDFKERRKMSHRKSFDKEWKSQRKALKVLAMTTTKAEAYYWYLLGWKALQSTQNKNKTKSLIKESK